MGHVAPAMGRIASLLWGSYYTIPLILATRLVVYYACRPGNRLLLHCIQNVVTYSHHQNNTCVTHFAGLDLSCSRLPNSKLCLCLSPAKCHILQVCYCYVSDAALGHICLILRSCHLLQYSLHFAYIACPCICFAIKVFYRSEIYCQIVTLSSTIPSVLQILR
jgi:hypothetical protein